MVGIDLGILFCVRPADTACRAGFAVGTTQAARCRSVVSYNHVNPLYVVNSTTRMFCVVTSIIDNYQGENPS